MKKTLLLICTLLVGTSAFSQTVNWYYTSDGIDPDWTWDYKDIAVPQDMKIDSVYGGFRRPGYPADAQDFIFSYSQGAVYDGPSSTSPWNYLTETNSLYGHWIDLTSFNYIGQGIVRIGLPVPAGAIWDSVGIAMSSVASIGELKSENFIKVYPNPSSDLLTIETPHHGTVELCNILGEVILSFDSSGTTNLNLSSYPAGIYFVNANGASIKFIKI